VPTSWSVQIFGWFRLETALFSLEALAAFGIVCKALGQRLDRDGPVQACVDGAINLAHAAGAD